MDIKPCPRCGNVPGIVRNSGLYTLAGSEDCLFCAAPVFIVRKSEYSLVEDWNADVDRYPRVKWLFDMIAAAAKQEA